MSAVITDERLGLPSASSMDGDIRCLGRRALMKRMPKDAGNKWADRGTKIHLALEGEIPFEELSNSDKWTTRILMDEEARLVDEAVMQGAEIISEKRLWALNENLQPIYSGQFDRLHKVTASGLMLDYKSGWSETVPIAENWQVRTNAALIRIHHSIKMMRAAVIHPHSATHGVSEVIDYTEAQLDYFVDALEKWTSLMTDDAPRTPNRISCFYCTGKTVCPEYQAQQQTILNKDGSLGARPKFELMTPEERGNRLHLLKQLVKDVKGEELAYKAMLKINEDSVTGWKLIGGQGDRFIPVEDLEEALDRIAKSQAGDDGVEASKIFSLTALEDHLQTRGMSKKKAQEFVSVLLGELIKRKPEEKRLVEK